MVPSQPPACLPVGEGLEKGEVAAPPSWCRPCLPSHTEEKVMGACSIPWLETAQKQERQV